jgi:hypothetical protein
MFSYLAFDAAVAAGMVSGGTSGKHVFMFAPPA